MLEDESHVAFAHAAIGHVVVVCNDRPAVGKFQACEDTQKRRLAGTGRAQQRAQ